jgi:hypothetical protein
MPYDRQRMSSGSAQAGAATGNLCPVHDLAKPAVVIVALSWSEVAFCQNEGGRHHSDTPGAGWQPPDPLLATTPGTLPDAARAAS